MMEPFYGIPASSPMWPGSGFGLPQTPLGFAMGHGAEGFAPPNISQVPGQGFPPVQGFPPTSGIPGLPHPGFGVSPQVYGLGGGLLSSVQAGPAFAPLAQGPGGGPIFASAGFQGIGGAELPPGITAAGLVAAIALRRGQPHGPSNDQEIEEFIYDALELLPGTNDVEVRCEGGRVTLTGSVQQKRLKRDVGEIAWAIPTINDVVNTVNIATKRRSRAGREAEAQQPGGAGRKQP